jgi:hypothetical protein
MENNNSTQLSDELVGAFYLAYQVNTLVDIPEEYRLKVLQMFGRIYEQETGKKCTNNMLKEFGESQKVIDYDRKINN